MPFFAPVRSVNDLPPRGGTTRSSEDGVYDFKTGYNPNDHGEMAKDVAAFANAYGGAIIVGASRDREPLGYPGLAPQVAENFSREFDLAHRDDLSPKPFVERCIIPSPENSDRRLLSVNVHPYPDQIVGARIDGWWRFPVRTGSQTNYVEPAMIPLFNSQARRAAILLGRITLGDEVELVLVNTAGAIVTGERRTYRGIDQDTNVLKLENHLRGPVADWHPLDQVFTVYLGADKMWRVKIRC